MKILSISSSKDDFKETVLFNFRESNPLADFEELFPVRVDQYASELAWLYFNLNKVINHNRGSIPKTQLYSAFSMWKSCNTISGSIEIFGRGYSVDSISLLRNVIESLCVNIHLSNDLTLYEKIKSGDHDPKKSINPAKEVLPAVGKLWGSFSKVFNHFNYDTTGASSLTNQAGKADKLLIGGGFDLNQKGIYTILISQIDLVLIMVRRVAEKIFHDFISDFQYWEKKNGFLISKLTSQIEDRHKRLEAEIQSVLRQCG